MVAQWLKLVEGTQYHVFAMLDFGIDEAMGAYGEICIEEVTISWEI